MVLSHSLLWAASEGPNSPDAGANDASFGTVAWTNPGNVLSSNDSDATATSASAFTTQYLKATDFDFAIPAGATIDGIISEAERADGNASRNCADSRVRIVKADGTIGTTDKAAAGNWPTGDAYASYGSSTDLWGETWGSTDINDIDFGFVIAATGESGATCTVDHMRVTVHYTAASGAVFQRRRVIVTEPQ